MRQTRERRLVGGVDDRDCELTDVAESTGEFGGGGHFGVGESGELGPVGKRDG